MVKRRRTLNEDLLGLGRASMTIGMGSMMVGVPVLQAPPGIKASFITAGSLMPVATIGMMGKHIIGQFESLKKKKYRWY